MTFCADTEQEQKDCKIEKAKIFKSEVNIATDLDDFIWIEVGDRSS